MKVLDDVVLAWNALIREHEGTPLEYLARVEAERIDRAKVAFVELNRHRLNQGNELVVLGYSQLLSRHVRSKNHHRHLLDFGDYYVGLAREYSLRNDPQGLDFHIETFEGFARSAMKLYAEVAQQDGALEKLEAGAKPGGTEGAHGTDEETQPMKTGVWAALAALPARGAAGFGAGAVGPDSPQADHGPSTGLRSLRAAGHRPNGIFPTNLSSACAWPSSTP